ncbi:MAG: thioesterase family protein [Henriciella sp.]
MNLFFRKLWIYLRAQFSSKSEPFDQVYCLNFRVWLTDQDMFLHMTNSRYLSISDLGRMNMLIRTGIWRLLKQRKWTLGVQGQTRTIARMLKSPQTFEIACQIEGWTEDLIAICHRFQRGGKVHAEIKTLMHLTGADGRRIPVSALLEALGTTAASPPLSEGFEELLQSITSEAAPQV